MNWMTPRPAFCGETRERWVFPLLPLHIPVYDGGFISCNFRPDRIKVVWLEWVRVVEVLEMGGLCEGAIWQVREEAAK
jgi:hypothetical protein